MAVRIVQNNFVSGELSPSLWGRHDIKAYFNGAAELNNFVVRRTGGIRKRPGTDVIATLAGVANQLNNRFVCFPYLYDSTNSGIVILYAYGAGATKTVAARFIAIQGATITEVGPWDVSISSTLAVQYEYELNNLRCKQIGDTLFFTRGWKQPFKCVVTFDDDTPASSTLAFSMIAQTAAAAAPDAMTVTPYNFKFRDKIVDYTVNPPTVNWETYGYQAATRKYALYGVKDGVFSAPCIRTQAMYMPWSAGAYIELSFYPRWDLFDYYVLGKLNGSQYGIIGEFYPSAGDDAITDLVYNSHSPSGAVDVGCLLSKVTDGGIDYLTAPGGTGVTGVASKIGGNPDATAEVSDTIALSQYASLYKSTDVAGTSTCILPQFYFTGASGFTGGRARICLGGTVMKTAALASQAVSYYSGTPMALTVTPFNYAANADGTAGELTYYTPQELTVQAGGYIDVVLSAYDYDLETGEIKHTWGAAGADGCIKHIGFKVEYASADERIDDCIVLNGVAFDGVASGAFPDSATFFPSEAYDGYIHDLYASAPEATYSTTGTYDDGTSTPITIAWNTNIGTAHAAINDQTRLDSFEDATTDNVVVSMGAYHTNTLIVGDSGGTDGSIIFTWAGGGSSYDTPKAMKIWKGALMKHGDGSLATENPGGVARTVTLYQSTGNAAGPWTEIGSWTIWTTYAESPMSKEMDVASVTGGTQYFKITFSAAFTFRGLALIGTGSQQVFKDDNISSGSITGIQDKLTVGDSNMDCRTMDLWQQRLVMASSSTLPFTMWFSVVGDLYNFYANRPQVDSDAFSATIPATKASKILHLVSGKWLTIFTESGEYICDSAGGEGFSFRSINIRQVSSVGIHPTIEPIQTEDRIIFVAHDGRSVYEMRYDLSQDSVIPVDRSVLAYHLTEAQAIVKVAYQRYPDSVVWFLLNDGSMLSMTFVPDQEVCAWARHTISQPTAYTPGTLKAVNIFSTGSVNTGTGIETTSDLVVVFEVFDATPTRQATTVIERMRPSICTNTPTNATAKCADHIGITGAPNVSAKLVTLRPESPDFNTQGLPKNILDVTIRLRRAYAIGIKPSDATMSLQSITAGSVGASLTTLFTGDKKIVPLGLVNDDGFLEIHSTDDKPCEILSLVALMEIKS